jgi:hypothetical protein
MMRKFALAMLWLGLALVAAPTYAADPSTVPEGSEEKAEKGDLTEINKQLTNPVSELWSITFQQNNFRISPGIPFDQGERWSVADRIFGGPGGHKDTSGRLLSGGA